MRKHSLFLFKESMMKKNHRFTQYLFLFISAVAMFLGLVTTAQASFLAVDLTINNSGLISDGANSTKFTFDKLQSAGTGVLGPFLRIQNNGTEQGYNTSGGTPFDDKPPVNFTHDLLFSSLTADSNVNYNFVLDIGEPVSKKGNESLLSLDGLKLFSTKIPGQNNSSIDGNGNWTGNSNNLLWNMDAQADNYVLLDANRDGNPGNGVSDMLWSVPSTVFAGLGSTDYIILWSRFGLQDGATAGSGSFGTFEEWAPVKGSGAPCNPAVEQCGPSQIPEPTSLLLMSAGLIGFGFARRRRSA